MKHLILVLLFSFLNCSAQEASKKTSSLDQSEAMKISKIYKESNLGCGWIDDKAKDQGDFWTFDAEFGFAGAKKEVKVRKKDGAVFVDGKMELSAKQVKSLQ